jgi:Uma2 family endonuclease
MTAIKSTSVSVQDYFKALHESAQKLEYHFGEIVSMAGVQANHAKIHSNILGQLFS